MVDEGVDQAHDVVCGDEAFQGGGKQAVLTSILADSVCHALGGFVELKIARFFMWRGAGRDFFHNLTAAWATWRRALALRVGLSPPCATMRCSQNFYLFSLIFTEGLVLIFLVRLFISSITVLFSELSFSVCA